MEVQRTFRLLDTDKSGKVDLQEFKDGITFLNRHLDGPLTGRDSNDYIKFLEFQIDQLYGSLDKDGDGLIDYEDFLKSFFVVDVVGVPEIEESPSQGSTAEFIPPTPQLVPNEPEVSEEQAPPTSDVPSLQPPKESEPTITLQEPEIPPLNTNVESEIAPIESPKQIEELPATNEIKEEPPQEVPPREPTPIEVLENVSTSPVLLPRRSIDLEPLIVPPKPKKVPPLEHTPPSITLAPISRSAPSTPKDTGSPGNTAKSNI